MFIAREKEMQTLRNLADSNQFEFLIMYGRRRVGKTELLNQISKEYHTLFYSAQKRNDSMNLLSFSKQVSQFFLQGNTLSFETWSHAFEYIGNNVKERILVIIDEFPFLAEENYTIMSMLQHVIDHNWKSKNIMLILCGSSISFMEKEVLSAKSPLYGRRTASMEILPFDYYDASKFTPDIDNEVKACIYGIMGGIPKYLELFDSKKSFQDNVKNNILKNTSYLFDEPEFLMRTELRETGIYNSILETIANGNAKVSEISDHIHEENTKTSKYLNVLCKLRILERLIPATEDINRSKKTLYVFNDLFFRFWYSYIFPNKQQIELFGEDSIYPEIESSLSGYMGLVFEKMCHEYLIRLIQNKKIDFIPKRIGKWWGVNPYRKDSDGRYVQDDIDILAYNDRTCLLGECKFTNEKFKYKDLVALQEISQIFHQERKLFYLFSKIGFDSKVIEEANKDSRVHLVTLEDIYNLELE